MAETYIISDTHFGHVNSLTFIKKDGSKLRDFASVEEMDGHPDPRYLCMSVEQKHVAYTPVPWYRVKEIMNARQNA